MKLTKEELFTLQSVLQIAKVHVNNDVVCAEYAGETSGEIEYLEEILNLQKRINKTIVRRHKQSFKKSEETNTRSDDWAAALFLHAGVSQDDGQPDEAQEWHDFNPDC
jgi:hypothetical protein